MKYIKLFLLMLLRAYKRWISPLLGPRCRFYPSCSDYMYEAITRHGIVKGIAMGSYRLLRCNPLCKGGYDPVP
ncbi:MAG: membrane protein insertion efficiency factor YidD [Defluviitaleaceae bacterium]|nr:membrane protein insertion efficiency factor YidD [Defluviitaleaceae bacterium]